MHTHMHACTKRNNKHTSFLLSVNLRKLAPQILPQSSFQIRVKTVNLTHLQYFSFSNIFRRMYVYITAKIERQFKTPDQEVAI